MAHTPSAKKRAKTYLKARARNRLAESIIKKRQKAFGLAVATKDKTAIAKAMSEYHSALDKAAKKGSIKSNQATRKKTRAIAAAAKAAAA